MNKTQIILTTTPSLEGWEIVEYLGPVSAQVVAGTGLFSDIAASVSDIVGGRSGSYQKQLSSINAEVLDRMRSEAVRMRANCVLGLRVDHDEVSGKGKSMFMVTASGTAVVAKQIDGGADFSDKVRRLSRQELAVQVQKLNLLRLAKSKQWIWGDENLNFIALNRLSEFVPHLLRAVENIKNFVANPSLFYTAEQHFGRFVDCLEAMPHDAVQTQVYQRLFEQEHLPPIYLALFHSFQMLDLLEGQKLLASNSPEVRRRGLVILNCEKSEYTNDDIPLMVSVVEKIKSVFVPTGQVFEKQIRFSKKTKQLWTCEGGHTNEMDVEFCDRCGKDIRGFESKGISPDAVVQELENQIEALRQVFGQEARA